MRIIEPSKPEDNAVTLDRSKPIVVFDPWPFVGTNVELCDCYVLHRNGDMWPHDAETLMLGWPGLGIATDGRPVIIHRDVLAKIEAGEL